MVRNNIFIRSFIVPINSPSMFKLLYTFILVLFLASCSSGVNREHNSQKQDSIASDTNVVFSKVAVLKIPFPEELNDSVHIFNTDMSVYATFSYDRISEETRCKALEGKVITYAPSWNLIDCFYEDYDAEYGKIRIGDSWKLIRKEAIYDVHSLDSYFSSLEYYPEKSDVFYQEDLHTIIPHKDPSSLKCKVMKVKNDWFLIQDGDFKAWVRWKHGSKVLQDRLRYDI